MKPLQLGMDWSRSEVEVYDPRSNRTRKFAQPEDVAKAYPGAHIFTESTMESYELQRRNAVIAAFAATGCKVATFKTDRTAQFRIKHGISKSDTNDSKVLYRLGTETDISPSELAPLRESDPIRETIQDFLVEDRYLRNGADSKALAQQFLKEVIPPTHLHDFIFSGKKFRNPVGRILAVAQEVRKANRGYREFRRQVGNYGNGYGSMPRSEFYWWWVRTVLNARLKQAGVTKKYKEILNAATQKPQKIRKWSEQELVMRKQTMKDATNAAKWLWQLTSNSDASTFFLA